MRKHFRRTGPMLALLALTALAPPVHAQMKWTQRTPAVSPAIRRDHAMAYDSARRRVVLFGGSFFNDTWEWDGTRWHLRNPPTNPPAMTDQAMAYDTIRQRVVLFGVPNTTITGQTWEWDGTSWTQCTPATSPPYMIGHALAYDLCVTHISHRCDGSF